MLIRTLLREGDPESKAQKIAEMVQTLKIGNVSNIASLVTAGDIINTHILKTSFYYIQDNNNGYYHINAARHLVEACYNCLLNTNRASWFTCSSTCPIT